MWATVPKDGMVQKPVCGVGHGICINPHHYGMVKEIRQPQGGTQCVVFGCTYNTNSSKGLSFVFLPNKDADPARYTKYFWLCRRQDIDKTGFKANNLQCTLQSELYGIRKTFVGANCSS